MIHLGNRIMTLKKCSPNNHHLYLVCGMINKQSIMARGPGKSEQEDVKVVSKDMKDRYLDLVRFSLLCMTDAFI